MTIEKYTELSEEQKSEIAALEEVCYAKEGLSNRAFLSNELNVDRTIPSFYLGYKDGELVAFLTTFIPEHGEAEVVAFTRPDMRRRGLFRELFNSARGEMKARGIGRMIFAKEPKSLSGAAALKSFGETKLLRSEYRMVFAGAPSAPPAGGLRFEEICERNSEDFMRVESEEFGDADRSSNYLDALLHNSERTGYVMFEGERPVGVYCINFDEFADGFICGVVVTRELRGRGYGKKLMTHALSVATMPTGRAILDVDSENPAAFELYKKLGFKVTFQVDYYLKKI
ncbi:MAG: GNAT family N-acetyltransferase [Ruminococcaceae bacterium]|nr:GNAT family N-acetyltransferase [Oscillospiraceae bacterium]